MSLIIFLLIEEFYRLSPRLVFIHPQNVLNPEKIKHRNQKKQQKKTELRKSLICEFLTQHKPEERAHNAP